ncbi:ankyrin repeat domain-containing protein 39 [Biomphalaria pfeifferi]|uniref:Ankyrin repeat domain-containing protein 39 n=1 Tax=Biomphalaria pfeifferi TaxID=112525 RepID=A0AAD8C5D5_BIOPF|nr:ankyrin repeat domain-containing protein 39 [Biomphalaria pfeifferi]
MGLEASDFNSAQINQDCVPKAANSNTNLKRDNLFRPKEVIPVQNNRSKEKDSKLIQSKYFKDRSSASKPLNQTKRKKPEAFENAFLNSTSEMMVKESKEDRTYIRFPNRTGRISCLGACGTLVRWPDCSCDIHCFVHHSCCQDITWSCVRLMQEAEELFGKDLIQTGAVCDYELNVYVVHYCPKTINLQTVQFSAFSSMRNSIYATDNVTGITFKNNQLYHCFQKKGSSPLFWKVKVNIDPFFSVSSMNELALLMGSENKIFLPPDAETPRVACTGDKVSKDFQFSMIVDVQKEGSVELTRKTSLTKEWTKIKCDEGGKCRQEKCRNHVALLNNICIFQLVYHICIIHPPKRHFNNNTIVDLASDLLVCVFSVHSASIAEVIPSYVGAHVLSYYGDVFKIEINVNGTLDRDIRRKINLALYQYFEENYLFVLYAPHDGTLKNSLLNYTRGSVWFCYSVAFYLKSKPSNCYTKPETVTKPPSNFIRCGSMSLLSSTFCLTSFAACLLVLTLSLLIDDANVD